MPPRYEGLRQCAHWSRPPLDTLFPLARKLCEAVRRGLVPRHSRKIFVDNLFSGCYTV